VGPAEEVLHTIQRVIHMLVPGLFLFTLILTRSKKPVESQAYQFRWKAQQIGVPIQIVSRKFYDQTHTESPEDTAHRFCDMSVWCLNGLVYWCNYMK